MSVPQLAPISGPSATGITKAAAQVSAPGQDFKITPPSMNEINSFEAAKIQSMPEIRAQAPQQPSQIMSDISSRLDSISANYSANAPGKVGKMPEGPNATSGAKGTAATQSASAKGDTKAEFSEMFNRFQDMQMFTVRANLVSNGASSSTHTFNSLLKGQ